MITKYDVGDEVLIKAKIMTIQSYAKDKMQYALDIKNVSNYIFMDEDDIVSKRNTLTYESKD